MASGTRMSRRGAASAALVAGLVLVGAGTAHSEQLNRYWNTEPQGKVGVHAQGSMWKSGGNVYTKGYVKDTKADGKSARVVFAVTYFIPGEGYRTYPKSRTVGGAGKVKNFSFNFGTAYSIKVKECTFNSWGERCGKNWTIYKR
ncbi:hypothetical protein [Streptomyces sp. NPDC059863]|uniref:hypothetical protein n=1 Tax=unclassified Streptomyces TaxID=2593676 RepID=UPI00364916D5